MKRPFLIQLSALCLQPADRVPLVAPYVKGRKAYERRLWISRRLKHLESTMLK